MLGSAPTCRPRGPTPIGTCADGSAGQMPAASTAWTRSALMSRRTSVTWRRLATHRTPICQRIATQANCYRWRAPGYPHRDHRSAERARSRLASKLGGFKRLPGGPADRLWLPMKRVRASLGRCAACPAPERAARHRISGCSDGAVRNCAIERCWRSGSPLHGGDTLDEGHGSEAAASDALHLACAQLPGSP
jgi:hypothetical protein